MGSGLNIQPRPVVALPRKAGARRVQSAAFDPRVACRKASASQYSIPLAQMAMIRSLSRQASWRAL